MTGTLADAVLDELERQMPFLRRAAESADVPLGTRARELEAIAQRLASMDGDGWLERSVKGYVALSLEFLTLQRQLEKTGRYLLSSEREAFERVYSSPDVFLGYYLPGLLLSEALWPNHYRFGELFRGEFLQALPEEARVLEVGVGSGYHLRALFDRIPGVRYEAIDISSLAVQFAKSYALGDRTAADATFAIRNVMEGIPAAGATYDAVVCGEVLEHVEHPEQLLAEIRRVLRPGGVFFMTTVAFAANVDHIYLFENAEQIRALLRACGWSVKTELVLPVYPADSPDALRRPLNYATIATPA
ncbi:MAG: class I SAM-dependent methyltransferase [Candidatus Eremiobacteraeota bacterium]|nr:class I SAM-dependent methyltransferase [Candidatus Eremiobacteraeota bacterium]